MLLRKVELQAIKAGEVSVVFRRWRRPTVKTGGTLKTAIGVLAIDSVKEVQARAITKDDLQKCGCKTKAELLSALGDRDGSIYRVELHYAGADPRLELREKDDLSEAELEDVIQRLERLDSFSRRGPWTQKVLRLIEQHPHVAAGELATGAGYERDWLKTNVRKLKNLGRTISHHPGYEVSPRGAVVLRRLRGGGGR